MRNLLCLGGLLAIDANDFGPFVALPSGPWHRSGVPVATEGEGGRFLEVGAGSGA
ncbi:hypothetical protein [Haloferula sargassicola]|uniref:SAM-dependent methyltransferase n=1 Tax=Haloferula sargassicola TaxID=490096 RepID=A0ABP9UIF4_9BACT